MVTIQLGVKLTDYLLVKVMLIEVPVTIRAGHLLPGFININRMPEGKRLVDVSGLVVLNISLGKNGMTKVTISRNNLSILAFMIAIVAPEAPIELHMTDMIWIGIPVGFHFREEVFVIPCKEAFGGLFDHFRVISDNFRVI